MTTPEIEEMFKSDPVVSGPDWDKVIDAIFSEKHINLKTRLNKEQIAQLARASVFAERYDSDVLRALIRYLIEFSVSYDARGRKDMVDVFRSLMSGRESDESQPTTTRKRFLGF